MQTLPTFYDVIGSVQDTPISKSRVFFLCAGLLSSGLLFCQESRDSVRYHFPVVTTVGTRYAEAWIDVPLSLNYIQQMNPRGKGYGLDEALSGIPGVLAQSRFGNQDVRLTIRGFGARGAGERSNAGTTRGVRFLTNGFPETEPDGRTSLDLIDLSGAGAIEVVRSNASSLYGNASGGVVNILANTMFDASYAAYTQSIGSFGFHKELVSVGAMLGSGRFYLSLGNTSSAGWRHHSQSSHLLLNTGVVTRSGEKTELGVHLSGTSNIFRIPGPLSQAQYDSLAQQADSLYVKRDERRHNQIGRIGVNVSHELDDHTTISGSGFVQPKYLQRSERGTFRDFNRYHVGGSVLVRHKTAMGVKTENTFLAGIDEAYQDGAILFYNFVPGTNARGTLRDNKREGANAFGAFLQDELSVGENWLFVLGGRYDNVTYFYESFINAKLNQTKSFARFTPKAGITYKLSPTRSIFLNVGGGVEVPAGNETDPAGTFGEDTVFSINPLLEPMRSTTIEVGTKQIVAEWGGNRTASLTYDLALYWLRVTNDIIPYRGGRFYFTAGKTDRMGIEIGARLQTSMGFSIGLAFTATSNTYREYLLDSIHYSANTASKFADYSGNRVAGLPDVFYSLSLKHELMDLHGAYVQVEFLGVGRYYADDANKVNVPAYSVINACVGLNRLPFARSRFYVSTFLGVNNVMDLKYVGSAWLNPDLVNGKPVFIEAGLPRNFAVSLGIGADL